MTKLENLKQPPFNTTLMGVIAGVSGYFGYDWPVETLFGTSGHAFMINIHKQLCPSGPYVWNDGLLSQNQRNAGIVRTGLGFFGPDSTAGQRAEVEAAVRQALNEGRPASLLNMENQLITGYDGKGLIVERIWECCPEIVTPSRLTYGSWEEFGGEIHVSFQTYDKCEPATPEKTLTDAIAFALAVQDRPEAFDRTHDGMYATGSLAYDHWIDAVRQGHGAEHGNWWNGMVWSECREMAARYLMRAREPLAEGGKKLMEIAWKYHDVAAFLCAAKEKDLSDAAKTELLGKARKLELEIHDELRHLA